MADCDHGPIPQTCSRCEADAVVSVDGVGSCTDHLDEVFVEAAVPLGMILMAATKAFGEGTSVDAEP